MDCEEKPAPAAAKHGSRPGGESISLDLLRELAEEAGEPLDSAAIVEMRRCIESLDRTWGLSDQGGATQPGHPERLGRFRILGELGRGGFGVVFLAEDPVLGRKLALKVPRLEVLSRGDAWRRFLLEASAASRLDHPNLVPVLETGEIGPVGYIASVYVDGPSLETWLARRSEPVPPRLAARLVASLARAIDHAHRRGILHRDLKPANVLLQVLRADERSARGHGTDSLPFTPRICDFGLAKLMEAEAEESQSIFVAGSPPYMAPEQAEGRKADIGRATDVYGLGAILYELLTGRPPFRGKNNLETLKQVVADDAVPPRQVRPGLPRDLQTICLKCLAKKPSRRYATAAALADDLERYLQGRTIQARPASRLERAWKWSRRHPALAALLFLMVLAGAGSMAGVVVLERYNARLATALSRQERLVATYRVRQAQQALGTNNLGQARELLQLASASDGAAGSRDFPWNFLWRDLNDRIRVLDGHAAPVTCLRASPDGCILVSGDRDGAIRLWDPQTGQSRALSPAHHGPVLDVTFSPDGRILASTARSEPGEVFLWELASARFMGRAMHTGPTIVGAWFTPDGKRLVALNAVPPNQPHRLLMWDLAHLDRAPTTLDPPQLEELGMTDPRVEALVGMLDGKEAVSGPASPGANPSPRGLAFTDDGSLAVVGLGDETLRILSMKERFTVGVGRWNRAGGCRITYSIHAADWAHSRPHFDRLDALNRRRVDEAGTKTVGYFEEAFGALSPTGGEVVIGVEKRPGLILVEFDSWQERGNTGPEPPSPIREATYLPDGATVAYGAEDGRVRLWRLNPRQFSSALSGHAPAEAWDVAFSPDGRRLATSGDDGFVRLWDVESGRETAKLKGHRLLVATVAWSPDGKALASAGWDDKVRIWNAVTGEPGPVLEGHERHVREVAFSPDGGLLASGSDDFTIRLWDPKTGRVLAVLRGHLSNVDGLAFSPDGRHLASGSWNGKVWLWDLSTRRGRLMAEGPGIHKLAFSPDGRTLALAHQKAPPRLWDMDTGEPRAVLLGHRGEAYHVCFSPDGKMLATAGMDRTVRLWDAASGQELISLTGHEARVNSVAFSPDGRILASVDHSGAILLWRADPGSGEK